MNNIQNVKKKKMAELLRRHISKPDLSNFYSNKTAVNIFVVYIARGLFLQYCGGLGLYVHYGNYPWQSVMTPACCVRVH